MFQINSDSLIGKILQDGEVLFREGEPGRSMFIVLEGKLEVYKQDPHYGELHLETMAAGDVVGITSLFTKRPRSVSVRALGAARVLTIDKRGLLKRIQENPSVGLRLFEKLSTRILDLNEKTISHKFLFKSSMNDDIVPESALLEEEFNIKKPIFTKLIIAFFTLIFISVTSLLWVSEQHGKELINYSEEIAINHLQNIKQNEIESMEAFLRSAMMIEEFRNLYLAKDRDGLSRVAMPLFRSLQHINGISHFNIIDTDRRVFLRLHQPEQHGDKIERHALLQVEQTGDKASGIEIGLYGTLTLRVILPWHYQNHLLGYLEIGKPFFSLYDDIKQTIHLDFILLADKNLLDKNLSHEERPVAFANWPILRHYRIIGSTLELESPSQNILDVLRDVDERGQAPYHKGRDDILVSSQGPLIFFNSSTRDSSGREVGRCLAIHDGSLMYYTLYQQAMILILSAVMIFITLALLFRKSLDGTQKKLKKLSGDLAERNLMYRTQIENLREKHFLFSMNSDLNITYISPSISHAMGYAQKDCIGHCSKHLTKNSINLQARRHLKTRFPQKVVNKFICEAYHKDGNIRTLEIEVIPVLNTDGRVMAWEGIAHDATDSHTLQKLKEYLSQSYMALHTLLQTSLEPISLLELLERTLAIVLSVSWLSIQHKGAIFLTDEETGELVLKAHCGLDAALVVACHRVKFGQCLCGKAALRKMVIFSKQVDEQHTTTFHDMHPHGHYCVPILSHDQKLLGVFTFYLDINHAKNDEDVAFLTAIANTLANLIQQKRFDGKNANRSAHVGNM